MHLVVNQVHVRRRCDALEPPFPRTERVALNELKPIDATPLVSRGLAVHRGRFELLQILATTSRNVPGAIIAAPMRRSGIAGSAEGCNGVFIQYLE